MKRKALRFAVILLISLFVCFPFMVNAEKTNNEKYNTAMVVKLAKFLTTESPDFSQDFDINSDGKVDTIDLTLLKRYLIYGTSPYITEETTVATTTTEKVTTTTAKTTTTSSTTTTTKATTTTAKATTTTTKATTTTTTTKITTTTSTVIETTTTVTVTTANSNEAVLKLIDTAIENISIADTTVPKYSGDLYEVKDAVFLFKVKSSTYAYTLLSDKEATASSLITNISLIKGVHIWKYTGKEKAVSIYEALPDTEDLTFYAEDPTTTETEFEYELKEYSSLFYNEISAVAQIIANNKKQYAFDIGTYDYSLNGNLDIEDVEIMTRYLTSELHNLFWNLNSDALNRYTKKIHLFTNHTNVVLLRTDSTEVVPYAFNIPTADLGSGSTQKSLTVPVQILPTSYENELSKYEENADYSDGTADYYAWDSTTSTWAKVSSTNSMWKFQAGYYVFVLDDDGNYCYHLVN